jgi:hypothetical protein
VFVGLIGLENLGFRQRGALPREVRRPHEQVEEGLRPAYRRQHQLTAVYYLYKFNKRFLKMTSNGVKNWLPQNHLEFPGILSFF